MNKGLKLKYIILFSGYNQRAVIAFLRTLTQNHVDNYIIFAASEKDSILKTEYRSRVFVIRKNKVLDYKEIESYINDAKLKLGFEKFVIPPTTEALNRFLIEYEKKFNLIGYITSLVSKRLYELVSDKLKFSELCFEQNILIPERIQFPQVFREEFVAKPLTYYDKEGRVFSPILIETKNDFRIFDKNYPKESFYYQRYIHGRSIYLLYYFPLNSKNLQILKFSQENFMQQPYGKSILVAKPSDYHLKNISDQFEMLFQRVGYTGFVMVELRVDGEKPYMIEANPRFWGPSQLFVDAGCNFFEVYLNDYKFINKKIDTNNINMDVKYFWHSGTVSKEAVKNCFFNDYRQEYLEEFSELVQWDIYKREDTNQLFLEYE